MISLGLVKKNNNDFSFLMSVLLKYIADFTVPVEEDVKIKYVNGAVSTAALILEIFAATTKMSEA